MKSLKTNRAIALLILACLSLASFGLFAQERELQTERDGFRWYILKQGDKRGAQSMSGTTFIPLSRGYTFICYHTTYGGWFSVNKNGSEGACDITGREIVAPGRYDKVYYRNEDGNVFCNVELNGKTGVCDENGREIIAPRYELLIYSHGVFEYKNSSCNWVSIGVTLEKSSNSSSTSGSPSSSSSSSSSSSTSTASTSSSTSSSNTSSSSKKYEGLLYQGDYTEGTLVGQRTGWTMAPAFPQHFGIRIYEDHLEDMGTWKYEGKSMNGSRVYSTTQGWGSSAQTVKYYVDGSFNITAERVVCSGIGPCETYVSQFSKGNVAFNINNVGGQGNGGWNGGSNTNGGNSGNTQTQQKTHKCGLCNGTGRVVENNATSFGNTKYCSECRKTVPDSHYHTTCPSCKGKGSW